MLRQQNATTRAEGTTETYKSFMWHRIVCIMNISHTESNSMRYIFADLQGIHLDDPQPAMPPISKSIDYSHEASEYEKKLVQVWKMSACLLTIRCHYQF